MFYLLHKRKLLPIEDDNTYTKCTCCGRLFQIDLADAFDEETGVDLYGLSVCCPYCAARIRAEHKED